MHGDCAAASVISVLCNDIKEQMNKIFLCTFGVGLSYVSAILDITNTKNYTIIPYLLIEKK